jgi:hypothetical protein
MRWKNRVREQAAGALNWVDKTKEISALLSDIV